MKCDICGKNNAIFHIQKISNKNIKQINLCLDCAKKKGFQIPPDAINQILSDFLNTLFNISNSGTDTAQKNISYNKNIVLKCPSCGKNIKEVTENNKVGCKICYSVFKKLIDLIIINNNNSLNYRGKLPKKLQYKKNYKEKIEELKSKLSESILVEDYKSAKQIRDQLRNLKNNEKAKLILINEPKKEKLDLEKIKNNNSEIISSRIRVLRNLSNYMFPEYLSEQKKIEIEKTLIDYLKSLNIEYSVYNLSSISDNEKLLFNEKFGISIDYLQKNYGTIICFNNNVALTLNNNDHFYFSSLSNKLSFYELYNNIYYLESLLENKFNYAVNSRYGYLSSRIKESGLGLKISVLLNLPGIILQKKDNDVFKDLTIKGYSVKKWYNEIENNYFYIISSNICYGVSEENLIIRFISGIESILNIEKNELFNYYNKNKEYISDIIYRSFGILNYARFIDFKEAIERLSYLLMGIQLGFFKVKVQNENKKITYLINEIREGNITSLSINNKDKDIIRAKIIREYLNNYFIGEVNV